MTLGGYSKTGGARHYAPTILGGIGHTMRDMTQEKMMMTKTASH